MNRVLAILAILLMATIAHSAPDEPAKVADAKAKAELTKSRPKTELEKENFVLRMVAFKAFGDTAKTSTNSCSGSSSCCCQAGTYGTCLAPSDCADVGTCVASAPGC